MAPFSLLGLPKDGLPANILDNFALRWRLSKEDIEPLNDCIRAETAGLAADKAERRRITAGTPERNSHHLKYNRNRRLWVSLPARLCKSLLRT
jgi:hypothetical protein